jgi:16S rRNA U1498 N3-methylase RsmE
MFGAQNIHPIIFEECYVREDDAHFVQLVRTHADLTEQKLLAAD